MDTNTRVNPVAGLGFAPPKREPKGTMDKDDFLKLYLEQLKNQDPMDPMDTNEMSAQMAQFSTVEQLVMSNKTLSKIAEGEMQSAVGLIGFKVSYMEDVPDENGKIVSEKRDGIVKSVTKQDGKVILNMADGKQADLSRLFAVELPD